MKSIVIGGMIAVVWAALFGQPQSGPQCQTPLEMRATFENLNFAQGIPGSPPPGWFFAPESPARAPDYEAKIAPGLACRWSTQCATVRSIGHDQSVPAAFLYQIADANPYRGKRMIYSADVRTDVTSGAVARLLIRVHRPDCSTSFRNDMGDHPITASTWSPYEIQAPISPDARDIEFGLQLAGQGTAWIDNVRVAFVSMAP